MTTSDDRFVNSSINSSPEGTPLGLILNQLIIITLVLKQGLGIPDDDFAMLQTPAPNFVAGVTPNNTTL